MSDEPSFSLISRLFNSSNSRKGTAIHQGIVAVVLLVVHTIQFYSSSELSNDFINFSNGVTYYAIVSFLPQHTSS